MLFSLPAGIIPRILSSPESKSPLLTSFTVPSPPTAINVSYSFA